MSYDLMVFDPKVPPRNREAFMAWYNEFVKWSEDHDHDNPEITPINIQNWFHEMRTHFPAMNGPFGISDDEIDNPKVSDYCITTEGIYVSFSWSQAEEAHNMMYDLSEDHNIGFFDVSANSGFINFGDGCYIEPGSNDLTCDVEAEATLAENKPGLLSLIRNLFSKKD
ncbi:MAG: hypothetical protein ACPGVN_09625 [Alphaproteobacteria bacterium]